MRGRLQVEFRTSTQARANTERDWLTLQIEGRSYTWDSLPVTRQRGPVWLALCNVAFDLIQDTNTLYTAAEARMFSNPLILAGSSVGSHECRHEDASGDCSSAVDLRRAVKPGGLRPGEKK